MKPDNATKRPWHNVAFDGLENGKPVTEIYDLLSTRIAVCEGENRLENADLIVKAVNSHDALVEALRKIYGYPIHSETIGAALDMQDIARAALALAEGGK